MLGGNPTADRDNRNLCECYYPYDITINHHCQYKTSRLITLQITDAIAMILLMDMKVNNAGPATRRIDHRRIGKKILSCSRTANLLYGEIKQKKWHFPKIQLTKKHIAIACGVVLLIVACGVGYKVYDNYQIEQKRIAAEAKAVRDAAARIKSNECRAQKVAAKSDQIGKITYDELYDYTVCDYLER